MYLSLSLYCFMTLRKSNIAMEHGYINHPTQGIQMGHGFHAEYEATRPRGTGCSGNFLHSQAICRGFIRIYLPKDGDCPQLCSITSGYHSNA